MHAALHCCERALCVSHWLLPICETSYFGSRRDMVRLLLQYGANPEYKRAHGRSPLALAQERQACGQDWLWDFSDESLAKIEQLLTMALQEKA